MSEPTSERPRGLGARLAQVAFVLGSIGLMLAMTFDSLAVLGRHLSLPLLGSIEIVEACIVLMACASLIGTTLERGHASVHLLTERLPAVGRRRLGVVTSLLCALFFGCVLVGSLIVLSDLWLGDERSDLLGIPIAPLRVIWCASAAGLVVAFSAQALSQRTAA